MKNLGLRNAALLIVLGQVAAGAAAESGVKISGMLDIGIYRDTNKDWQVGPIQRSNVMLSGQHELGDGLTATFALSHRFDTGTGANESDTKPIWHGESTVGLKGAFGSVQAGRRLDAIYANDWNYDPWGNFDRIASPAWDLWHYNFPSDPKGNKGTAEYGRLNHGIFYDSPSFGGVTVHLSGSPQTDDTDNNKPYAGAVQYQSELISGMLAHGKNSAGNTDTFLAVNGKVAGVSLMGAYDESKAGASKAKSSTIGAAYTMNLLTLRGGAGQVDLDGVKAEKMVGLGANYNAYKDTNVYADLARKKFTDRSATTYGLGVSYSF